MAIGSQRNVCLAFRAYHAIWRARSAVEACGCPLAEVAPLPLDHAPRTSRVPAAPFQGWYLSWD